MTNRLDKQRQHELEPQRLAHGKERIEALGYKCAIMGATCLTFHYNGSIVHYYPYSGWHTGKTITDGRGLQNLLNQIKPDNEKVS